MIHLPQLEEIPSYYQTYTQKLTETDLMVCLSNSAARSLEVFQNLSPEQWNYAYAPGKWTIAEVLIHIIDTERVMAYRALRFARKDNTTLPGFDQDIFAEQVRTLTPDVNIVLEEFRIVRRSTELLFQQMNDDMLDFKGSANGLPMTARVLGFIIAGHNLHHLQIIHERYL